MKKNAFILLGMWVMAFQVFSAESTILGGDLFDKGTKLGLEEVKKTIVSESSVEQINGGTGGIRRWKNGADGKFIASRVPATGGGIPVTGQGEWKLTDNGQYCVQIEWRPKARTEQENWCRVLWKLGDVIYLAPSDLDANRGKKYGMISFSK